MTSMTRYLAYGHTVFHGIQLLRAYGVTDVEAIYPLVRPGGLSTSDNVSRIRNLLAEDFRTNLGWLAFPPETMAFQIASAQ